MFNIVLSFIFDVVIVVAIFRRMFASEEPTSETIFAALCIYLLVGFSFAGIYGMVAASSQTPFIWIRAPTFIMFPTSSISFTTVLAP
jgi:hypothetical protein